MDLGLKDARVFVAASRSGLGAAAARRFSLEGAQVAINSRNAEALTATARIIQDESGNSVIAMTGDISAPDEAATIIENAATQLGGLDILVTNAGGPPHGYFTALTLDEWADGHKSLLLSFVQMVRASLPYLRQSDRASIVAITSLSAKQSVDGLTISNTYRAGISGLVKSLANELGPDGIRVNAILPGWTATDRVEELLAARATAHNTTVEDERIARTAAIPLKRMGTPEHFGNVVAFIASPAAGFVHGAMIPVDGGEIKANL